MEDFRLKVFKALAREGSFTKAASVLGITQPAVSQHIAELEKTTGTRLFDRLHGEVVLTAQGRIFMDYADKVLAAYGSAESMFTPLQSAVVRIAASDDLYANLVCPAMETFATVHPDVTFVRTKPEDADLVISLAPSPDSPFDIYPETIAKVRVSLSPAPKKMGDFAATHEKISYFDLMFRPSETFAGTKVCRSLKDYFASLL